MFPLGSWVVYSDDGLKGNWDNDNFYFASKAEAIAQIAASKLDIRKTPKVERVHSEKYLYYSKTADAPTRFGASFTVEKVTAENVTTFEKMLKDMETQMASFE